MSCLELPTLHPVYTEWASAPCEGQLVDDQVFLISSLNGLYWNCCDRQLCRCVSGSEKLCLGMQTYHSTRDQLSCEGICA